MLRVRKLPKLLLSASVFIYLRRPVALYLKRIILTDAEGSERAWKIRDVTCMNAANTLFLSTSVYIPVTVYNAP